jgi:hypothetical protein
VNCFSTGLILDPFPHSGWFSKIPVTEKKSSIKNANADNHPWMMRHQRKNSLLLKRRRDATITSSTIMLLQRKAARIRGICVHVRNISGSLIWGLTTSFNFLGPTVPGSA